MIRPAVLAAALLAVFPAARGGTLYHTEFEEFTAGENHWAGTGGWMSNDTTSGAQGIIQDPVADLPLGRAGYLGHDPPASAFTTVFRTYNHDPAATGLPRIAFESLLGVQDSTNGRRDRFLVSFYNTGGDFLAALTFDNTTGTLRRDDGAAVTDTGVAFIRGEPVLGFAALQILGIQIDLEENRWSAEIDGIPVFSGLPFTATGKSRTLGAVAAEWEIAAGSPAEAGNNWLLVADWLVGALPREPFELLSFERAAGQSTLAWQAHPGFDYRVLYSPDLTTWSADLPGASYPAVSGETVLHFIDDSPEVPRRFYRVERSLTR